MNTDNSSKEQIQCPTCEKPGTWEPSNQFKPFCSRRCKLIDLGEWASETRKIPVASREGVIGADSDGWDLG